VVSGADGWEAIEAFGPDKLQWLRQFAPFNNAVPSHEGIAKGLSGLSPKGFQEGFGSWTRAVATATQAPCLGEHQPARLGAGGDPGEV